jgi:hypothetical protein
MHKGESTTRFGNVTDRNVIGVKSRGCDVTNDLRDGRKEAPDGWPKRQRDD